MANSYLLALIGQFIPYAILYATHGVAAGGSTILLTDAEGSFFYNLIGRYGLYAVFFLTIWEGDITLLLAGVLGNLTDRLLYGHVIDFLLFDFGSHVPSFLSGVPCAGRAAPTLQSKMNVRLGSAQSGKDAEDERCEQRKQSDKREYSAIQSQRQLNRRFGGLYNLGSGQARTWNDLVKAIFAALGKPPRIDYIEMPEPLKELSHILNGRIAEDFGFAVLLAAEPFGQT